MASAFASSSAAAHSPRGAPFKAPITTPAAPQGTFLPGTKVQVGSHRVTIEKYLSEGGFAHVYVVRVPQGDNKHELAVLKRVAVPDKSHLASMRTEVETMKKVKGHKHVVTYMDSHASQLKGGGYEVFLLMEYCAGGGLIDFMNTRLQHRLTEPEILKIFGDVAEGVACMHYLKPPLLHRDLKVENVLIGKSSSSGTPIYKLCDFGSTAAPRPAAKTAEEGRLIEEDVQKHTTMQYRSPEMIDVWRKQPIDEKADIWALGVLLYKLCYYTTPFEDVGQMAILNASYKFPPHPVFSDKLKKFISWMLKEDPKQRPNIYQVVKQACSMQGTEVPIRDIYANRTESETRRNQALPSPEPAMAVGLQKEAPKPQTQILPDIAPMRRGRPTAAAQPTPTSASKPSASPAKGDPFAALDSKNYEVRAGAVNELSQRFPSLDEFTIVHDKGGQFAVPPVSTQSASGNTSRPLSERVTAALADQVFSQASPKSTDVPTSRSSSHLPSARDVVPKAVAAKASARASSQQSPLLHQPRPVKPPLPTYKSTGVGSSPPRSAPKKMFPELESRPIWRVPDHSRSSSQPRASVSAQNAAASLQPSLPPTQRPALHDIHRSKSQTATLNAARSPTSSRPSLEGRRPSQMELGSNELSRARSAQARPRPSSVYVSSNLDFLKDQEVARKRPSLEAKRSSRQAVDDGDSAAEGNISDDIEYLRSNEADDKSLGRRKSSGHAKRSSLASISGGAKSMLAGKFGDAFKRFESQPSSVEPAEESAVAVQDVHDEYDHPRLLSPIQGSETAQSRQSYPSDVDSDAIDETEDLPPDMRREMERRKLSLQERRVAEAAAEYKQRGPGVAPTRGSTIQKRVQSLLDEGRQSPVPHKRTAEGYGRYTDSLDEPQPELRPAATLPKNAPPISRKPQMAPLALNNAYPKTRQQPPDPPTPAVPQPPASAPPTEMPSTQQRIVSRPSVPPKAQVLRTGGANRSQWPPIQQEATKVAPQKPTGGLAALLAKDLEGVPDYPPRGSSANAPAFTRQAEPDLLDVGGAGDGPNDDLEEDFSRRYPSLSGIELVERDMQRDGNMTMREV